MKKLKKIIIAVAVIGAVGVGSLIGWTYLRKNNVQPVKVFSFDNVGMTQYWGDTKESYGPVSTDNIQTIYLSDTQTVSEILVEEGQTVKKGDLLMSFDTTLSQLELERKKLEIQKLEMDLEDAYKEAQRISWMTPMGVPPTEPTTLPTAPATIMFRNGDYSLFREKGHDGSSPETAMICWMPMGKQITREFLQEKIGELIQEETPTEPTNPTDSGNPNPTDPGDPTGPSDAATPEETTAPTAAETVPETTAPEQDTTVQSISGDENLVAFIALLTEDGTVENVPQTAEETPGSTDGTAAPAEGSDIPTEGGNTPTEGGSTPTEGGSMPTEGGDTPTEGGNTPTEGGDTPTEETPAPEKYGTVVCNDAVNIRSGPGTDYPIVDSARNGQRVAIYESVDVNGTGWGRIGEGRWICLTYVLLDGAATQPTETPTQPAESTNPTDATDPAESTNPTDSTDPAESTNPTDSTDPAESTNPTDSTDPAESTNPTDSTDPAESTNPTETTDPTEPDPTEPSEEEPEKRCRPYYVVFKVTENNYLRGEMLVWVGAHVNSDGSFSFFDARNVEDVSIREQEPEETEPTANWMGSGYTYTEIQKMKEEQDKKIKDLEIDLKLAEADLKLMERELSDGNIYSEQDGKVISLLTEEDARLNSQPIMKVSGGGGYYVEATVSELDRDTVAIGMEVTINDWDTGNTYTGEVISVGDIPSSSNSYNGMNNPNASSYPFRVFVDESADLKAGSYVSVEYSSAAEGGIYLQNPFLRTVQGRSFVYVLGEDGKLEERTVTVGKTLGGSYTQILDGLTVDDLIAFPYGKNVKPGVPAEKGDMRDLYN